MPYRCTLAIGFLVLSAIVARAQDAAPAILDDVGIDQRLNEQVPLDLAFRDEAGRTVRLGDYFQGKPVVLVLAYYKCPMLCTLVLNGLGESLRQLPFDVGNQFNVVTVSFDPRETPALAAAKKDSYIGDYGRPGAAEGWHFLTGEEAPIKELTRAVGFRYAYDAKLDQFAHGSGVMVLTPDGKLSRYFFGVKFEPTDLRLGLVEASENKIGSPIDQVLLRCYRYDAATGKYHFFALNLVRLGGALTVVALAIFLLTMWRRDARKARETMSPVG